MLKRLRYRNHTPTTAATDRLASLALAGLISLSAAPAMASGESTDAHLSADTWESLLTEARAQARQCGGDSYAEASPVTWDARLGAAAQAHSEDMANMGQMSHEGSEGKVLADRLGEAGYEARAWAENVAAGQRDAASVVAAWLDSPGHCANIMSTDYEEFGAGVDRDESGKPYWTLVLAAPRG
ncbi:CAP domain-containing protein [Marinobacter zhanjiangensis]|nr:CAP domain-containing protein [Marinobacter zhanjiangensis]